MGCSRRLEERRRSAWADTNVGWHAVPIGDQEFSSLADQLSEHAFEALPDSAPVRATRGAAMIRLREVGPGKDLVIDAEIARFLTGIEREQNNLDLAAELDRFVRYLLIDTGCGEISRFRRPRQRSHAIEEVRG
jgi:hypothetical protein